MCHSISWYATYYAEVAIAFPRKAEMGLLGTGHILSKGKGEFWPKFAFPSA